LKNEKGGTALREDAARVCVVRRYGFDLTLHRWNAFSGISDGRGP